MIDIQTIADFIKETAQIVADVKADSVERSYSDVEVIPDEDIEVVDTDFLDEDEPIVDRMGKSGCLIGMGLQALELFGSWRNGEMSTAEYASEIIQSSGAGGLEEMAAGILMPIKKAISYVGTVAPITIPIAVTVVPALVSTVKECVEERFNRDLESAYFYQSTEQLYSAFQEKAASANEELRRFINEVKNQQATYVDLQKRDKAVTQSLKNLYDSI